MSWNRALLPLSCGRAAYSRHWPDVQALRCGFPVADLRHIVQHFCLPKVSSADRVIFRCDRTNGGYRKFAACAYSNLLGHGSRHSFKIARLEAVRANGLLLNLADVSDSPILRIAARAKTIDTSELRLNGVIMYPFGPHLSFQRPSRTRLLAVANLIFESAKSASCETKI